jgi:hypothetical protein
MQLVVSLVDNLKERKVAVNTTNESIDSKFEPTPCELNCDVVPSLKNQTKAIPPFEKVDEAITQITSAASLNSSHHDNIFSIQQTSVDSARNELYLNPSSGDKWLSFTKALVRELLSVENAEPHSFPRALSSAKAAASMAYNILHDTVVNASVISPTARYVLDGIPVDHSENKVLSQVASADILSEALSLVAWLDDLENVELGKDATSQNHLISLQEAYLLDPLNAMAAQAVQQLEL